MSAQSKREMKQEVQDVLLHHMKSAFYEAIDNEWPPEKVELMRREATRAARFFGYETLGSI
jgi:hypothetical protein